MERPVTAWVLAGMIAALVFSYAYYVNAAIVNIVATKDMQVQISDLTSQVGNLETQYLAAKSALTIEDAHSLGFAESLTDIAYVSKRPSDALSFNR
ncbi:MAG: hypothetical protein WC763_00750 [Candidatus Paceibacterota bacterium]